MGHKVKIGSKIKLYYDGKLGRMTIAEIIGKKQLHKIKVVVEDDCGTSNGVAMKALVEGWLKRKKIRGYPTYYTGYVKHDDSLMDKMWCCGGDYYATYCETPTSDEEIKGYT